MQIQLLRIPLNSTFSKLLAFIGLLATSSLIGCSQSPQDIRDLTNEIETELNEVAAVNGAIVDVSVGVRDDGFKISLQFNKCAGKLDDNTVRTKEVFLARSELKPNARAIEYALEGYTILLFRLKDKIDEDIWRAFQELKKTKIATNDNDGFASSAQIYSQINSIAYIKSYTKIITCAGSVYEFPPEIVDLSLKLQGKPSDQFEKKLNRFIDFN